MFIRVVQGKVTDETSLSRQYHQWRADIAPDADGWLGATLGMADGGQHLALLRFESAATAQAPDPGAARWWDETAPLYAGLEVHDCPFVQVMVSGGSDDAGFVQILQGRARDRDRVQALNREFSRLLPANRPGVMGATVAWDGSFFTDTVYFPSEEVARQGEVAIGNLTGDYKDLVVEWNSLVDELVFFDLRAPDLLSP